MDAESGRPLAGANVQVLGTILATITDHMGKFAVQRVPDGSYALPAPTLLMRASAARGFRVPTVAERSMTFGTANFSVIPSEKLNSEHSWSYEAGIRKTVGVSSYMDAAVFQNDYRDFVEPLIDQGKASTQVVVSFQNVPDARIRGFELAGGTRGWWQHLQLEGGLTFLDSKDLYLERPLAYRPRWSGQLSSSLHLGPVHASVDDRYVSRLQRVPVGSGVGSVSAVR